MRVEQILQSTNLSIVTISASLLKSDQGIVDGFDQIFPVVHNNGASNPV